MKKKISVLLPNYNNGPYLKEALDSVFAQTYQNFIIYFIDDCSTDNSVAIAELYQGERLIIVKKEQNSGIVDTMNIALDLIDTEFYIRMDGDDISTPERFERLIEFMETHTEIGVCTSYIKTFGIEESVWEFGIDPLMNRANLIFGHSIGHASSIFRTKTLKENNISYVDRFWRMEDYYLFYQLKDLTLTTAIPEVFYLYRRENYNTNSEIEQRKAGEFRKFIAMVLTDLGIEPNDIRIALHLQLNNRENPTFSLADYKSYLALLLRANKKAQCYPKLELERILTAYFKKMIYRLIDQKNITFIEILRQSIKDRTLLRYYLGKRFKKNK